MQQYRARFIEFLLKYEALKFGNFTLKSGRQSPYFFNLGVFNNGKSLSELGKFYAQTLQVTNIKYDMIFGPAYKGIPLACTTSIALYNEFNKIVPYCFNRKEAKDHGDSGMLVGAPLKGKIIMLDDVITAGTTVRETLKLIDALRAELVGIVIAFDRQERGIGEKSAIKETVEKYGVPVYSIVTLDDIIQYMQTKKELNQHLTNIETYREVYGA